MKALVVYESMFGHTEQVARAVVAGVSVHGDVDVLTVASLSGRVGAGYDIIIVGGPTHTFSMSRPSTRADALERGATHGTGGVGMREWLDQLDSPPRGALFATFDTRVRRARLLPGSAAKAAARRLRGHGFHAAAGPESFYVLDVAGPLAHGELERAEAWGTTVALSALQRRAPVRTDR